MPRSHMNDPRTTFSVTLLRLIAGICSPAQGGERFTCDSYARFKHAAGGNG
ncbi:hypothetical protein EXIGLDRAFT_724381, partial [Exidia glandulosa HHB12029]